MVQTITRPRAVKRKVEKRRGILKRQRPNRHREPLPRLVFLEEAQPLLTPFLTETFQMIYQVAKGDLGSSLKSARVSTWIEAEDENPEEVLVLSMIADKGWSELGRMQKKILDKIAQ